MALREQINTDMVQAMRESNVLVRDVLRLVKTAIKNSEINKGHDLADEEVIDVLTKEVKQRQESATAFKTGGRTDLAEKEEQEITVLKPYLPTQLAEQEIAQFVDEAITETGALTMSDMGKVMAALMPKTKGKADGNVVSQLVKARLNS